MVSHHLVNESSFRENCPYCSNNLLENKWISFFDRNTHYKRTRCDSCKKSLTKKVDFVGSGHDRLSRFKDFKKGDSLDDVVE